MSLVLNNTEEVEKGEGQEFETSELKHPSFNDVDQNHILPTSVVNSEYSPKDKNILLHNTNRMLSLVGIQGKNTKRISSVAELQHVASSMFVAIYESLFNQKLDGIIRNPDTFEEYEYNAQLVIDGLCGRIHMDLKHITGKAVANGDLRALSNLISIFIRIANITGQKRSNTPTVTTASTNLTKLSGKKSMSSFNQLSDEDLSNLDVMLSIEDVAQIIRSNEQRIKQIQKLEVAKQRRESIQRVKEQSYRNSNQQKFEKSTGIQTRRQIEDYKRVNKSQSIRSANQEYVLLRKIYAVLLKKIYKWQAEEKSILKELETAANKEVYDYVKTLQNGFEARIELLQEEIEKKSEVNLSDNNELRKYNLTLKNVIKEEFQKLNEKCKVNLAMKNQLKDLATTQGYENLLAKLHAGDDWTRSLRGGYHLFD